MYTQIALPLPLEQLFTYAIPKDLIPYLQAGMRVKVPFGRGRTQIGICIEIVPKIKKTKFQIKNIIEIIDKDSVINPEMMKLAEWMSQYYRSSLGECLEAMVPSFLRQKNLSKTISYIKITCIEKIDEYLETVQTRSPLQSRVLKLVQEFNGELTAKCIQNKLGITSSAIKTLIKKNMLSEKKEIQNIDPIANISTKIINEPRLSYEQKKITTALLPVLENLRFFPILLHGITGSGKTEIYMQCIQKIIANGKQAIVLVPEIALTPQTVFRFKQRFSRVAVLHSELTNAQRNHQWQKILRQEVDVVIGPRSALFAPLNNLGLIVVDEEHEPSFKQQNAPRYNARDLSVKRAHIGNIPVILGSATPSLESYHNVEIDKYHLYTLNERIGDRKLPDITVIDMKEECQEHKKFVYFSRILLMELKQVISKKQQAILFLNRRGFATSLTCPQCGYSAKCNNCNISLTYHKKNHTAICHYCNFDYIPPKSCPVCRCPSILYAGAGTQKIELMLRKIFPEVNIMRMDSDTMVGRGKYEEVLSDFGDGKIDILLGTQMIAKGLDFPNVTLVGVISADTSLQVPDFRAAERTFQLIVQVAGRSGRGDVNGKVIVQTYQPDHYAIQTALTQNYYSFLKREMTLRKDLGYPPFGKLIRILVQGEKEQEVERETEKISREIRQGNTDVILLGPAPAPIDKIKNRYRHHIILKCKDAKQAMLLSHVCKQIINAKKSLRISIDVDPLSLI